MKKQLLVMGLMLIAVTASGQRTSSSSSSNVYRSSSSFEGVSSFYIQYDAVSLDDISLNGIGIGFTHSWGISSSAPLYIQSGIGFQYAFGSEDEVDYNMYSVSIPVNLGYQFQISDGFALAPYLGVNARYYLGGKAKVDDYEIKLFDSDEGDCNAFAFGWQIGVKALLGKTFAAGISYGTDFTEMVEDADKIGSLKVTLSFNF